jgi:hypothetical protein
MGDINHKRDKLCISNLINNSPVPNAHAPQSLAAAAQRNRARGTRICDQRQNMLIHAKSVMLRQAIHRLLGGLFDPK